MNEEAPSSRELGSWKEIADYLRVSVRTAQVWEREKGLPVRRMPGERGRVSADSADLDRWKHTTLRSSRFLAGSRYLQAYALVATVLLAGAGARACWSARAARSQAPVGFRVDGRSLVVTNGDGNTAWRKTFPAALESRAYSPSALAQHRKVAFGDVNRDGAVETLFVYEAVNSPRHPGALFCFSRRGDELWRFVPTDVITGDRAKATHVPNDLLLAPAGGKAAEPRVLLLECGLPGHLATLFTLSGRGEMLGTYEHRGHLDLMEAGQVKEGGVQEILLGGFGGEPPQAELVAIEIPGGPVDARQPGSGASRNRLAIRETAVLAFPRTCVNRSLGGSNRIASLAYTDQGLSVGVSEVTGDDAVEVVYQLDRNLAVRNVWFSDALKNLHRALEAQGLLDHPLTSAEIAAFRQVPRLGPHDRAHD